MTTEEILEYIREAIELKRKVDGDYNYRRVELFVDYIVDLCEFINKDKH